VILVIGGLETARCGSGEVRERARLSSELPRTRGRLPTAAASVEQGGVHLLGGREPPPRLLGQGAVQHGPDRHWKPRDLQLRRVLELAEDRGHGGLATERQGSGEQLVDDHPEGVEVAPKVHRLTAKLLGAHVLRGAHERPGGGHRVAACPSQVMLGDAEVHDADDLLPVAHQVRGLQVPVNDAGTVDGLEAARHLEDHVPGVLPGETAGGAGHPSQVLPVDELHADVAEPPVLTVAVDRADVAVPHPPCETDLGAEATLDPPRLPGHVRAQDLDGDRLAELLVPGLVDHPHPTAPERAEDLEPGGEERTGAEPGEPGMESGTAGEAGGCRGAVLSLTRRTIHWRPQRTS